MSNMTAKKEKEEKEYRYISLVKCEKCGKYADELGPCSECKNDIFVRVYKVEEK